VLIDSHCHLDQFSDPQGALAEAQAAGVRAVLAVSENAASMPRVLALKRDGAVYTGLGLHPAWVVQASAAEVEAGLEWLEAHLPEADVMGEVGLDHRWATTEAERVWQAEVFERQLVMAAACGKPLNLHSRRCLRQVMERAISFKEETGLNVLLHWFTQSKKLVRLCNEAGIYVSVGPTVIDDGQTQAIAAEIADELLLLETDAPVVIGGRPGHPAAVRQVAETLAGLKGVTWQDIAAQSSQNFIRYLGLKE
jgi:TatD DNase family protein